ncbi:salicylate hydroxylase [Trichoderma arundinaceum]|uniref:Salicylate hydroxylase n=1 Tax=Trichoderma arundinaceum TaxID=490622 RepID=A0A395NM83_TRIAR|nr:salicylate hydroxylase [Trichoderma arundinaceum]
MASANSKSSPSHFLENKTIVIAGAGLAGSAFVVGLQSLWSSKLDRPNIIIYERDSQDIATQRETYTLSLTGFDNSGGLVALRDLGLLDEALEQAVSGVDGVGSFKIWDSNWKEQVAFRRTPVPGIPSTSVRIARTDVRQVLHNAFNLDDQCVLHWDSQCVSATQLPDGRLRVQVISGREGRLFEQDCDLLIAADGANSKLRQSLRPDDILCYNGAVLRGGTARFEESLPPQLSEDWGFVVSRTGVSAFFSPVDNHSILWTIGQNEDQVSILDRGSPSQVQAVIDKCLELGSHIPEPFQSMVKRTDPKTVLLLNSRDKMPFPHRHISKVPAIFLGDSNHALSPFAGIGANLALVDGWDLANQICTQNSLEEAVKAYDSLSVPRAARSVKRSRRLIKAAHHTGWRYYLFWCVLFVGKFMRWVLSKMGR